MIRSIFGYGSVGGVIVGLLMAATIPFQHDLPQAWGMAIGYLTMLIALSTVFVAIKRRRDRELGGIIRFWPALGMGLAISLIAGLFYVLAWEIILPTLPGDFIGDMVTQMVAQQKAQGMAGAELAAFTAEMRQFQRDYADPLYRMPMTLTEILPVGVLVSLVSAGLLCNSRFLPARRPVAA